MLFVIPHHKYGTNTGSGVGGKKTVEASQHPQKKMKDGCKMNRDKESEVR